MSFGAQRFSQRKHFGMIAPPTAAENIAPPHEKKERRKHRKDPAEGNASFSEAAIAGEPLDARIESDGAFDGPDSEFSDSRDGVIVMESRKEKSSAQHSGPKVPGGAIPTIRKKPRFGVKNWPPDEFVALGQFLRPHGLRGQVRLYPYTKTAEELLANCPQKALIWHTDGETEECAIDELQAHQGVVLITLARASNREEAEELRGAFLCLREGERWKLPKDQFYVDDLTGLDVFDGESQTRIGRVIRVVDGPAHDFLEILPDGASKTTLAPFVRSIVHKVDIKHRKVVVNLPVGLLDLAASREGEPGNG